MERHHTLKPTRREFAAAALVGLAPKSEHTIAGSFVNDSAEAGHRLRSRGPFRTPARRERVPLVIVGGGMAGLSAAWQLARRGFRDFVLLEMEQQPGGVSRWGENAITAFPWGAHYVPVPGPASLLIRELLADLGVLVDGKWDERHLCFSPQERLFLHGRWQDGIEPETAATRRDHEQYRRFRDRIGEFRASGRFTIPMERAGGVPAAALDHLSMADWMRREGFDSPYLNWYVNYACRDDYGALAAETSAWAGIHYFASREPDEKGPLTWPEGNGWLVRRLVARLSAHLRTATPVYRIAREGTHLRVLTEETEYLAEAVIFAAPTFLAPYIVAGAPPVGGFEYSPWLTANLVIERPPRERMTEPAWDNVIYQSPALGYVVATHQSLRTHQDRSVWTYYWALAEGPAPRNRKLLLTTDWNYWKEAILTDLERAHPDIRQCVSRIDIMRLGHAMVRPRVGFLSSPERLRLAAARGPLVFAHSDLSGFSIIEEAQYRGVTAAGRALARLGGSR
jgi:glycine/D-amino acid oxidase-like deaminating enzyme